MVRLGSHLLAGRHLHDFNFDFFGNRAQSGEGKPTFFASHLGAVHPCVHVLCHLDQHGGENGSKAPKWVTKGRSISRR